MSQLDVFIAGERLDLVCLTEELALHSGWYQWFNQANSTAIMQKHYFPNTAVQQLQFFQSHIQGRQDKIQLGIVLKNESELAGVVSLSSIDFHHRKAEIAGMMGHKRYQKFVYMLEALKLLIVHGFDQLNLHRIYGGTASSEVAMMFERVLGFQREGMLREEFFKNGKYQNAYLFSLLRSEFDTLRSRYPHD